MFNFNDNSIVWQTNEKTFLLFSNKVALLSWIKLCNHFLNCLSNLLFHNYRWDNFWKINVREFANFIMIWIVTWWNQWTPSNCNWEILLNALYKRTKMRIKLQSIIGFQIRDYPEKQKMTTLKFIFVRKVRKYSIIYQSYYWCCWRIIQVYALQRKYMKQIWWRYTYL